MAELFFNDKHILRTFKEMKLACVFNPPVTGKEVHNADSSYELEAPDIKFKDDIKARNKKSIRSILQSKTQRDLF